MSAGGHEAADLSTHHVPPRHVAPLVHALLPPVLYNTRNDGPMATKYHPPAPDQGSRSGQPNEGSPRPSAPVGTPRPETRAGLSAEAQGWQRAEEEVAETEDRELAELMAALNRQIAATDALINRSGMLVKSIDAHWTGSPPRRRPPTFTNMPKSAPDNMRDDPERPARPPAQSRPPQPNPPPPKHTGKA